MPLSVEEAPTALSCEELNAMFLGGPALSSASLETGGFGAPRGNFSEPPFSCLPSGNGDHKTKSLNYWKE